MSWARETEDRVIPTRLALCTSLAIRLCRSFNLELLSYIFHQHIYLVINSLVLYYYCMIHWQTFWNISMCACVCVCSIILCPCTRVEPERVHFSWIKTISSKQRDHLLWAALISYRNLQLRVCGANNGYHKPNTAASFQWLNSTRIGGCGH